MTQKLIETFNLPDEKELAQLLGTSDSCESGTEMAVIEEREQTIAEIDEAIDKIDAALPMVDSLDMADSELDALSDLAKEKFEDMLSLGLNVEARYSGPILQTASTLLGHAISAKTAKIDKKLKMIQLQLQKAKLDQTAAKAKKSQQVDPESGEVVEGQAVVLDRNELLKMLTEQSNSEN